MKYDVISSSSPKMPKLGKGLESIKLLLTLASPEMRDPLVPMLFPVLGAHMYGAEFQYPDLTWKEPCGLMSVLIAESGCNKGQHGIITEALCRDLRAHDALEFQKLYEWQKQMKTKGANKPKDPRPEAPLLFPPCDITNPAFIQNAMECEKFGERAQFLNLPEIEMLNRMCGGHSQVTQILRLVFDKSRAGSLRATADGVIGNPTLRVNLTISATPFAVRRFFRREDLHNGTFGRLQLSYKPHTVRDGKIPRIGKCSDECYHKIDEYLARLDSCKGRFKINPLNKLVESLAEEMVVFADLVDDNLLWDYSKRSLVSAWKAGCIMWALNNQTWTRGMGEIVEWLACHDLWSKVQLFSDLLKKDADVTSEAQKSGPKNLLDSLDNTFSQTQLEALRESIGKPKDAKGLLRIWVHRGFVELSAQTGLYTKTEKYLNKKR